MPNALCIELAQQVYLQYCSRMCSVPITQHVLHLPPEETDEGRADRICRVPSKPAVKSWPCGLVCRSDAEEFVACPLILVIVVGCQFMKYLQEGRLESSCIQ